MSGPPRDCQKWNPAKVNFATNGDKPRLVALWMVRAGRLTLNVLAVFLLALSVRSGAAMRVLLVTGGSPHQQLTTNLLLLSDRQFSLQRIWRGATFKHRSQEW